MYLLYPPNKIASSTRNVKVPGKLSNLELFHGLTETHGHLKYENSGWFKRKCGSIPCG